MADSGIITNIEHLATLIAACQDYTTRYNPKNPALLITNLQTIHTDATDAVAEVTAQANPRSIIINNRQDLFAQMPPYCTRIIAALSVTVDVSKSNIADAKHWLCKIRGECVSKKILNPSPDDPKQISAAQRSYHYHAQYLYSLYTFVIAVPNYDPNETDLKATALADFYDQLNDANQAAIEVDTPWLNAISARDVILYAPKTGLVDIALDVKKYVKSVKEISSEEFSQISGLEFIRAKKKN